MDMNAAFEELARQFSAANKITDAETRSQVAVPVFKSDFPKYNGSRDPLLWLKKCELLFDLQRTAEADKVAMAAFHLEGDAEFWFIVLHRRQPHMTWEYFKSCCEKRFEPAVQTAGLSDLADVNQTGTVEEYRRQFEQSCARDRFHTEEEELEMFINGLDEVIAVRVRSEAPLDLTEAMSSARYYEMNRYEYDDY